jgi:hypothetical protein
MFSPCGGLLCLQGWFLFFLWQLTNDHDDLSAHKMAPAHGACRVSRLIIKYQFSIIN